MAQPTLKDIARYLGISESTVSRALNDNPRISNKVRLKVKEVAEQIGYSPNPMALGLQMHRSNAVGIIVPKIGYYLYAEAISGVEEVLHAAGFNLIICQSNESFEREVSLVKDLINSRIAGCLVSLASETHTYDHFRSLKGRQIPLVFFNRECSEIQTDRVIIDNVGAARQATLHLLSSGCKRVAFVGGSKFIQISNRRLEGYTQALQEYAHPIVPQYIQHVDFDEQSITSTVHALLRQPMPPDGILAFSDRIAQHTIHIANQLGIAIPDKLRIIGFNNEPVDEWLNPSLSSMEQPCFEMGHQAASLLLDRILNPENVSRPKTTILQAKLVLRNSTGKIITETTT